ncbi:MAG: hypothetical protein FWC49_00355 [Proteobacteria bacterium]|nr:hypothetical protein [Pseudomonadota bacterium]
MSEYRFFLLHKLLVLSVNILLLTALSVAMYRASLFPDDFTPTFFKTFFALLAPTLCLGFIGKRVLGKYRPTLV